MRSPEVIAESCLASWERLGYTGRQALTHAADTAAAECARELLAGRREDAEAYARAWRLLEDRHDLRIVGGTP